jgi:putative endonuclease
VTKPATRQVGENWERATESFLRQRGLITLTRNFYSRFGEIDLIMKDQESVVFVEVRFRENKQYGSGADSVTVAKQRKLSRAALYFLYRNPRYSQIPCRFDVVSVSIDRGNTNFDWIKNAFESPTL